MYTSSGLWLRPASTAALWSFARLGCSVIFLSLAAIAFSQKTPLTWSDDFRIPANEDYMGIVGHDGSGFYAVRQKEGTEESILLERYELATMKISFSKEVAMPIVGSKANMFRQLIYLGNNFLLFTSAENKMTGKFEIYCTALDKNGSITVKPTMVHFIPQELFKSGTKLDVALSPDSTKFMVFFDSPFERKAKETFQLKVYSTDFELLWQKDLELPYEQNVVQVHNYLLSNQGHVFLMSGWAPEKNAGINRFQRPQDGRYVLFHYNPDQNRLKEFDVSLRDKSIVSVIPEFAPNGDMVIGGFYSNDYLFSVAGTFLFVLDTGTDQVKTATMVPFGKEFLGQFIHERAIEKGNDLSDFYLDHIYVEPNGEVTMLGEQFYLSERVVTDIQTGRESVEYLRNFDDILAVKLDSTGFVKWNVKIPKRQSATDLGRDMSYSIFTSKNALNIFFNDNTDNQKLLTENPAATPKTYIGERNSTTTLVSVDIIKGLITRSTVSSNKETQYHLRPDLCYDFPGGPVILGSQNGKDFKYACYKSSGR